MTIIVEQFHGGFGHPPPPPPPPAAAASNAGTKCPRSFVQAQFYTRYIKIDKTSCTKMM